MPLNRIRIAASVLALFAVASASAAPFAYVPNEKSGTLSVIDTATDEASGSSILARHYALFKITR